MMKANATQQQQRATRVPPKDLTLSQDMRALEARDVAAAWKKKEMGKVISQPSGLDSLISISVPDVTSGGFPMDVTAYVDLDKRCVYVSVSFSEEGQVAFGVDSGFGSSLVAPTRQWHELKLNKKVVAQEVSPEPKETKETQPSRPARPTKETGPAPLSADVRANVISGVMRAWKNDALGDVTVQPQNLSAMRSVSLPPISGGGGTFTYDVTAYVDQPSNHVYVSIAISEGEDTFGGFGVDSGFGSSLVGRTRQWHALDFKKLLATEQTLAAATTFVAKNAGGKHGEPADNKLFPALNAGDGLRAFVLTDSAAQLLVDVAEADAGSKLTVKKSEVVVAVLTSEYVENRIYVAALNPKTGAGRVLRELELTAFSEFPETFEALMPESWNPDEDAEGELAAELLLKNGLELDLEAAASK